MRAEWRERSREALGFLCLYIGCVFLSPPSYWGNIWIQLRNWNQKVERLLNPNAKMERVQPPGSCSKKTCPSGRDQATKEHRQGKRWSEQQSPGWGCRSGTQEPGQHAKHPKEQKPSLYERGIPQTAPREVNWATRTWLSGCCFTLHSSRAGWEAENVGDPGSQEECLTDFRSGFAQIICASDQLDC